VNSKSPETHQEIIHILNCIKANLNGLSKAKIITILDSLRDKDKAKWDGYIWERASRDTTQYHESNNPHEFKVV
jgi:hypothetical protein